MQEWNIFPLFLIEITLYNKVSFVNAWTVFVPHLFTFDNVSEEMFIHAQLNVN